MVGAEKWVVVVVGAVVVGLLRPDCGRLQCESALRRGVWQAALLTTRVAPGQERVIPTPRRLHWDNDKQSQIYSRI